MGNNTERTVLFVCTANLCRSQAAESRLRAVLPRGCGIEVISAGTRATDGAAVPARFNAALGLVGIEPRVATQLTAPALRRADLVLTMTRSQRAETVRILPRAVAYTYTLTQFVRTAEASYRAGDGAALTTSASDALDRLLKVVQAKRGTRLADGYPDIPDPDRPSSRQLRKVAAIVDAYVDRLAALLEFSVAAESTSAEKHVTDCLTIHAR